MSDAPGAALPAAMVDEWVRAGVTHAVVSPGSRSTPLALALAADGRLRVEVVLDERSAAFLALGAAKASGRPSVVLCTSGTAAGNFLPAVLEAHHARVPLVVCTADRPPELRDTGAGQAIDQLKLYGGAVRWFCEVGVPDAHEGAGRYWRSTAARAVAEASGPPGGVVHLNLAFRDPLVPVGPVPVVPGRPDGRPWVRAVARHPTPHAEDVEGLACRVAGVERGVVVAGWDAGVDPAVAERFAAAAGWPLLADPLSGLRAGAHAVSTYDPLLRDPTFAQAFRPDLAVRLGAPLTSKVATAWLDASVEQIVVEPDGTWLDPHRAAATRIVADPSALLTRAAERMPARAPSPWLEAWLEAERRARRSLDVLLDTWTEPFEGRVARDVLDCLPEHATLVVGSSMPVRDLESFARPRRGVRVLANRGVNGIDGFLATVLGVASASGGPVAALCGDLTFLHDAGALLGAPARDLDAVVVVVDNDGGGIFSFLPQAQLPDHFDRLFGTPHGLDLCALAGAYGIPSCRVREAGEVAPAARAALEAGGVRLVVVPSDRAANVARHRQAWDAVAGAVAGLAPPG